MQYAPTCCSPDIGVSGIDGLGGGWLGLAKSQTRSPLSKHAGAQSCIMISDCSWNPLTTGTGIISIHKKMSTRSEQLPHISYHVSWLPSLTIIPFLISSLPKHINMIHVISSFIDSFVIPCLILTFLPLPYLTYCINVNYYVGRKATISILCHIGSPW